MKKIDALQISEVARPVVEGQGYELVEVEWKHELGSWVLRVFIDQQGGVSLDDCTRVSRELSAVLDVDETLAGAPAYTLEVSSPGLNRPLKREADFRRFVGKKARIRTRHPVGDEPGASRRNFSGTLVAVDEGPPAKVRIDVGDQTFDVPVDDVEKANLVFDF
jgi:ribosome maturation factor RimP